MQETISSYLSDPTIIEKGGASILYNQFQNLGSETLTPLLTPNSKDARNIWALL